MASISGDWPPNNADTDRLTVFDCLKAKPVALNGFVVPMMLCNKCVCVA